MSSFHGIYGIFRFGEVGGDAMTIVEMLGQSGILTLLGMGIVFAFLFIMVIIINLAGKLMSVRSLNDNAMVLVVQTNLSAKVTEAKDGFVASIATDNKNDQVIAAISAAISEYRASH